ncbi:conserved hypothetical protein [Hyphomicrobiales bacterium]|nr:conserved hypothetical protein [Hyphomicrobiales bacterium]CAI0346479.1 conserved hypothetical protein [Hyphomicrobiales bacterium]
MNQFQNQSVPCVSLLDAMRSCEQMPGLSVLAHGEMVAERYSELVGFLRDGKPLTSEWRLPDWIHDPIILTRLLPDDLMAEYHVFHDCGKPACLVIDEEGKRRFPNHAQVSKDIWLSLGGDERVGELIGMDMDAHLLRDEGLAEFAARPQAIPLLLTALAEISSNAEMFGGIESTSFKIKAKALAKRGKAVLKRIAA